MPKVTPEHQEARRQQILEASVYCFAEKGFHATTMKDICNKAQLSPGAVYLYFSGKDHLIEALLEYLHEMNKQHMEKILDTENLRDGWVRALDTFFSDAVPDGDLFPQHILTRLDIMFLAEALRNDQSKQQLKKATERNARLYHHVIKEAQDKGVIKKEWPAEVIGDLMENIYFGLSVSQTYEPDRSFKKHRDAVKSMMIQTFFV